jgi:uncharacterized protein involved in outer membrane biogenesis
MGKLEKVFYGFCFLIIIYIGFGFKVLPIILKDQLVKNLDENLTQKTTIENIEFNPLTLKAVIHKFKISDSSDATTIYFENLLVDFSLLKSIEKKHISFKDIRLTGAYVNLIEEKDGSLNLSKLLKPTAEEKKNEEKSSSSAIDFLVSKVSLENINIDYLKEDDVPYSLNLKDINYTLYDLGTYKNILSSNNLKFKLNENTNVSIVGAFKLQPFKAYGKVSIEDLRLKELLSYKKDLFNFDLDEKANLNLVLNYNVDTSKELDLTLRSDKFEFNHINLNQNNTPLINLEKLDIKTFDFDLLNQNITLNNVDLEALNANMILDKNGINFANLINQTTTESKTQGTTIQKEESKPWNINLSNLKSNNSNFSFNDKIHDSISKSKDFTINLGNLKIINSDINLDSFSVKNPNVTYSDNKNKLFVTTKNTNINLDKLNLLNGVLDINKIEVSKENISFIDKKTNINLNSKKAEIIVNGLKIDNGKTSIESNTLKMPNLNFEDTKSKMKVETSNINLDIKFFLLNKEDISIKDIKLIKPSINMKDKTNNIELNAKDVQLHVNNLVNKNDNLSINFIKLLQPQTNFLNTSDKTKIEAKNLNLEIKKLSNTKNDFKIERTNLDKPNISIILAKKDALKEDEKSELEKSQKNEKTASEKLKVDKNKKESTSSKQKINVGPFNITNGIFSFEDKNLPIPFKTTVTKLNGKISEFKNIESSTSNLELKGVVDEYGVAKITGVVHPTNIKFLTDINVIFNNIAIKNFTPYSGKFVGREIKSGKLDLDLKYNIEKSNLDAENNIVISKLELGEKVESPDAISLPLDIAIALLRDSNGVIDINLPISGNVDDPQFSIGSIVWKAFVNLMTKAITAPFSLLGALFNFSEDEIKTVKFDYLESEVGPIQKETLDKIAQILKSRAEVAIELSASFEEEKETYALKKQKYLDKKKNDKNLKQEEIETLISKETIKITDLETIAKNRISNINNYLIKEKGINPKQVVLTNKLENNNSSINLNVLKK